MSKIMNDQGEFNKNDPIDSNTIDNNIHDFALTLGTDIAGSYSSSFTYFDVKSNSFGANMNRCNVNDLQSANLVAIPIIQS